MKPFVLSFAAGASILILLGASPALSENLPQPKEFYSTGYVNEPKISPAPDASSTPRPTALPGSEQAQEATPAPGETPAPKETAIGPEYAEGEGEKPRTVSLLLSTAEPELLKKHYEELAEFSERTGLKLKDLFLVGDPNKLPSKGLFSELSKTGNKMVLRFMPRVPKEFGEVKNSPALLVETSNGVVVVEGYPSLAKIFSADGRFIEPTTQNVR